MKPNSIEKATTLLIVSIVLMVILILANVFSGTSLSNTFGTYVSYAISLAFMFLVITKIRAGKNWARILFAVFFFLGLVLMATTFAFSPDLYVTQSTLYKFSSLVQFIVQALTIFFLFTRESNHWFREVKKR